jgi:hypothetical protein
MFGLFAPHREREQALKSALHYCWHLYAGRLCFKNDFRGVIVAKPLGLNFFE